MTWHIPHSNPPRPELILNSAFSHSNLPRPEPILNSDFLTHNLAAKPGNLETENCITAELFSVLHIEELKLFDHYNEYVTK